MVVYLSPEQLVDINAQLDGGVGVADIGGVESNAARPYGGFGDTEYYSDLWTKVAAYLHGIATTQYFTDGNKRTAWLAANVFLEVNGVTLPRCSDIEAETLVQAVAQDVWATSDAPHMTLAKAAEWLRVKSEPNSSDDPMSWDGHAIGSSTVVTGMFFTNLYRIIDSKLDVLGAIWDSFWVSELPETARVALVILLQTGIEDADQVRTLHVHLTRPGGDPKPILSMHAELLGRAENRFFVLPLEIEIQDPGRHVFQVMVDDNANTARTVSLDFRLASESGSPVG